ncbi:MAG: mechanosensitive ion channel family protein [Bacteroidota bacterium]|nr:mechanosensitive ion channel family protein [Bacteroidota bacterium]
MANPTTQNVSDDSVEEQKEVAQEAIQEERAIKPRNLMWLALFTFLLFGFIAALYAVTNNIIDPSLTERWDIVLRRTLRAGIYSMIVLIAKKLVSTYVLTRLPSHAARYNIRRVLRLVTFLVLLIIITSVIFANWYTAAFSLGLISLILGFALQTPITSFIGWIYILIRVPYKVGNRIKIDDVTGDVIDIGYLDTTLWEFGGDYLSTDHPSGRIIKFPNSLVLSTKVFNYSWHMFPYLWNEVKMQVAYESDIEYVKETMLRVVYEEIGQQMMERVKIYKGLLSKTAVDKLDVNEKPSIVIRISDYTWVEVMVRYVVFPREAGRVKTRLIEKIIKELLKNPDRVMFPKSNIR